MAESEIIVAATATTSLVTIYTVPASTVARIDSLVAANIDGVNDATFDVFVTPNGQTGRYRAKGATVAAGEGLNVVTAQTPMRLSAGSTIQIKASAAGDVDVVLSGVAFA
ncbi:hypothetical protein [Aurantimonas sp. VKM B-3413]|uniref:hypothetical protein n=1 Tax=Aurantimonas sp. VKM B-3413 TaxID=2779401 RepID=UPI001E48229F|nr:hypothetical protein [Aurantimonas sp. VKM B-3413]MCB8835930.1 hypothetical protein [Aurantimonas sp. VKM B-3413]